MTEILPKVIRIFVGKGDFKDQNQLAKKRKKQGWTVAKNDNSAEVDDALQDARGAIVVANGAKAGVCMSGLIDYALHRGARKVIVPLNNVRTSHEGEDPVSSRATALARGLHAFDRLEDPRILVTPKHAWQKAKQHVEDSQG